MQYSAYQGPCKREKQMLTGGSRTLVYLEGDAKMSTFTDAESKRQSRLDLVERTLDVLALPQAEAESRRAARAAAGGGQSGDEEDQAIASA